MFPQPFPNAAAFPVPASFQLQQPWIEYATPEGRKYYFNTVTKIASSWKEYVAENGKKYYFNSVTRATTWDMPPDMLKTQTAAGADANGGKTTAAAAISEDEPRPFTISSLDRAEDTFLQMLIEKGVDASWSWEKVLRETISHPAYRAIDSIQRRKAIHQRFLDEKRAFEKQEARRVEGVRRDRFIELLRAHEAEFTPSSRYRSVAAQLAHEAAFRAIGSDREKERLFDDFIDDLAARERRLMAEKRPELMQKFAALLASIPTITHATRWRRAIEIFRAAPAFVADVRLGKMHAADHLECYEAHIQRLEADFFAQLERDAKQAKRQQRKCREAFRALLAEFVAAGSVQSQSKWKDVLPLLKNEPAYLNLVGNAGSTPIDLFFDCVDGLEEQLRAKMGSVNAALSARNVEFGLGTTLEEFVACISSETSSLSLSREDCRILFAWKRSELKNAIREERMREYRTWKPKIDAFKNVLKNLQPPIAHTTRWEEVKDKIRGYPEFEALGDEARRIDVFNRRIKKLKRRADEFADVEEGEVLPTSTERHFGAERKRVYSPAAADRSSSASKMRYDSQSEFSD